MLGWRRCALKLNTEVPFSCLNSSLNSSTGMFQSQLMPELPPNYGAGLCAPYRPSELCCGEQKSPAVLVLQVMCHTEQHTQATHWVIWNPVLDPDPPSTEEYRRS